MILKRITFEHILYLLILVFAFGVRIFGIDEVPLSDFEATRAVQALEISRWENPDLSPGPSYQVLTGLIFFLLEDTNGYARIWSIIAGSCLVMFPYLIRSLIGRKAALILAFGFAFSPSLVYFSRIASIEIMAVSFAALGIGFFVIRKPILAGIFSGLMLLSGPFALQGLLGITLAILMGLFFSQKSVLSPIAGSENIQLTTRDIWTGALSMLITLTGVGTLLFLIPTGLAAFTSTFTSYLNGWFSFSGVNASDIIFILIIYNPIVLLFGLLGIFNAWRYKVANAQWLSLWAGVAFLLAMLYPAKDIFSWLWFMIPLSIIAALEIARYLPLSGSEPLPALGQGGLIFLLMALGWLNLAGLSVPGAIQESSQLRWAIIAGTIVLGGITTLLVGLGWSARTAQQGLVWGLLVGLGFYSFSLMWGLSQIRANGELELISVPPITKNTDDFQQTLGDLSEWRTGMRDTLDVILTTSSPSLEWEMRRWENAKFLSSMPVGELPSVIISREDQPDPNLAIGYRGQDFTWWVEPGWTGVIPNNWPMWLVFRDAPQKVSKIILWARLDLFPGGLLNAPDVSPGSIGEELPVNPLPVE
jgi:hypothetical protein